MSQRRKARVLAFDLRITVFGAPGKDVRRVLECDDHYKQSAAAPKQLAV